MINDKGEKKTQPNERRRKKKRATGAPFHTARIEAQFGFLLKIRFLCSHCCFKSGSDLQCELITVLNRKMNRENTESSIYTVCV